MKIGIITDETNTQLVGLGTYTLNITKQILLNDKKNDYTLVHRQKESHDIYDMAKEIIVPYTPRVPASTIRNFYTLPRTLRKHNFDIVHHTSSIGPFLFKSMLPGKKNVQTVLDIIPLLYPRTYERAVTFAFRFLLPRAVRNADHLLAGSEHSKQDIIKYFHVKADKITVTYLAPHERYRVINKNNARETVAKKFRINDSYILYVGALEAKKNIPTLLRAYAKLREQGIDHSLVLAGKQGFGYERIAGTIHKLGLKDHVIQTGQIANAYHSDDLVSLYNAADVFAFPSVYEGFGMPVIEAMKCGTPVVSSTGGSLKEVVGDGGITVDTYDALGYARSIKEILDSKSTAKKLIHKGIRNAKRFSWKESSKRNIAVYESLG